MCFTEGVECLSTPPIKFVYPESNDEIKLPIIRQYKYEAPLPKPIKQEIPSSDNHDEPQADTQTKLDTETETDSNIETETETENNEETRKKKENIMRTRRIKGIIVIHHQVTNHPENRAKVVHHEIKKLQNGIMIHVEEV